MGTILELQGMKSLAMQLRPPHGILRVDSQAASWKWSRVQHNEIVLEVQVVLDVYKPLSRETGIRTHNVGNVRNELTVIISDHGAALLLIFYGRTEDIHIFCVRNLIRGSKRIAFRDIQYVRLMTGNTSSIALLRSQQLQQYGLPLR